MDKFPLHCMGSVKQCIQDFGCQVEVIPGGTTCHVQPVDIGVKVDSVGPRLCVQQTQPPKLQIPFQLDCWPNVVVFSSGRG